MDREERYLLIAWPHERDIFRCFKVPCKNENTWFRVLADSEDTLPSHTSRLNAWKPSGLDVEALILLGGILFYSWRLLLRSALEVRLRL